MKFLERFSAIISDPGFLKGFLRLPEKSSVKEKGRGAIGLALRNGAAILDESSLEEIRVWIISQQTMAGGFPDRGGDCDLYYTLFGFFLSDALGIEMVLPMLREYTRTTSKKEDLTSIEFFCLAILYSSLLPGDALTREYRNRIKIMLRDKELLSSGYTRFLICLSLLYLRDYIASWKALRSFGKSSHEIQKPCPAIAAEQILAYLKSGSKGCRPGEIMAFYRGNGGFAALLGAPSPDLLSTAVSLFALGFTGYDLRLLKPDCLRFVENCYKEGGFMSSKNDTQPDIEYTFYGLLALGALNSSGRGSENKKELR